MTRTRVDEKKAVPAPGGEPVGDSGSFPTVVDNPGEAPQTELIADAKAMKDAELEAAEEASLKSNGKGKIKVVALRAGYFKGSRKQEGDKFVLDSEAEMGDWMKKI